MRVGTEVSPAAPAPAPAGDAVAQRTAGAGAPSPAPAWPKPEVRDDLAGVLGRAVRERRFAAAPAHRMLQRTPSWLKDGTRDPRIVQFAEAVERRVLSAYGFLIANPSLGVHATLSTRDKDGHIGHWLTKWASGSGKTFPWPMFHANAGYAIESLATFLSLRDAPPGTYAKAQVDKIGTRPDLVLYDAAHNELCWVDITARRSQGHVELKAGPWLRPQNAEILYPSFSDSDFAVMRANDSDPGKPMHMDKNVRLLLATGMTRNRIELEEQQLRRDYLSDTHLAALRKSFGGMSNSARRKYSVEYFRAAFPTYEAELKPKDVANMAYAAGATVSVFFPKTGSTRVPTGLSRRAGDEWIARLAEAGNWPGVELSDERKREIRRDTEEELFRTGTRTRAEAVDVEDAEREERIHEQRSRKRKREDWVPPPRGQPWPKRSRLPPLERSGSFDESLIDL